MIRFPKKDGSVRNERPINTQLGIIYNIDIGKVRN